MKSIIENNKISSFLTLLILISSIPYLFIINEGTTESDWIILLMWAPALSGLIIKLILRENIFKGIGWNLFKKFHWVILAAMLPMIIEFISIIVCINLGFGTYKSGFLSYSEGMVHIKSVAMIFGAAPQPLFIFIGNFLLSFLLGNLFYMLTFALGEEYGWRGFLQPLFEKKYGLMKGLIALGLIWGYWHFPGILLGHNFPDYPIIGAFIIMPLGCVFLALVLGIAYKKTNLIWVPVMLHSSINLIGEFQGKAIVETMQSNMAFDIIWMGLWGITALFFVAFYKSKINKSIDSSNEIKSDNMEFANTL